MQFKRNRNLIISKNKVTRYKAVLIVALQACSHSYAMVTEEAAKLACEATGTIAALEGLKVVSGASAWVSLATNVYQIGKDVKSHFYPSKEEQVHAQEINKRLELIELRKNLRTCLIRNRISTQKGPHGIPSQCEQTAFALSIMGYRDEVDRMIAIAHIFNK